MWHCPYCKQQLPHSQAICKPCGAFATHVNAPNEKVEATVEPTMRSAAETERVQYSQQMSLREAFGLMTFFALVFAICSALGETGTAIIVLIIGTNLIGVLVGLAVTYAQSSGTRPPNTRRASFDHTRRANRSVK